MFRMTKPSLVLNVKQQYNSAPKSEVVSMLHTTWAPVLSSAGKPTMAEPSIPIARCMSINREQVFDVMGIVREVSEVRSGGRTSSGQERVRCTCKITDGSKMPGTDQTCDLPITIFGDKHSSAATPAVFRELQEAATNHTFRVSTSSSVKRSSRTRIRLSASSQLWMHSKAPSGRGGGDRSHRHAVAASTNRPTRPWRASAASRAALLPPRRAVLIQQ